MDGHAEERMRAVMSLCIVAWPRVTDVGACSESSKPGDRNETCGSVPRARSSSFLKGLSGRRHLAGGLREPVKVFDPGLDHLYLRLPLPQAGADRLAGLQGIDQPSDLALDVGEFGEGGRLLAGHVGRCCRALGLIGEALCE